MSWLIVAGLAIGGFAAFSPRPAAEISSTTRPAVVAEGRGISTARVLASAFANAAADRSFTTTPATTRATVSVQAEDPAAELQPSPPVNEVPLVPPPDEIGGGALSWPSGSECEASWYGPGFEGKSTANGETFDSTEFTAALHGVPFNTTVRVTRVDTGAVTTVRINDRGPYIYDGGWRRHPTRCVDLSEAAMDALGGVTDGVITVTISY